MHYLGYRELNDGRKVYCLRAEKVSSEEKVSTAEKIRLRMQEEFPTDPTVAKRSSKRRRRRPSARDEEYIFPGAAASDGNFNFKWERWRTAGHVYLKKPVMVTLVEDILGLKYPVSYNLRHVSVFSQIFPCLSGPFSPSLVSRIEK